MLSLLLVVLLTGGCLHHAAMAADVAFDDSFARRVCGGNEPPATHTLVELCLEMSAVGQRCVDLSSEYAPPSMNLLEPCDYYTEYILYGHN